MARPQTGLNTEPTQSPRRHTNENNFSVMVQDKFYLCLNYWRWYLLSLLLIVGTAYLVVKRTTPTYTRTVSLLIKDDYKNGDETLRDLGLYTSSNITNELLSMKSYEISQEIAKRLGLNVSYSRKGNFHDNVAYGTDLPIKVNFIDLNDNEQVRLTIATENNGNIKLSDIYQNGSLLEAIYTTTNGDTIETAIGRIQVERTPFYREVSNDEIVVKHVSLRQAAESINSRLFPVQRDKNSTIIDVYFTDHSIARAEDVLTTFVQVYNENWMNDRNRIAVSTSDFIKERLNLIEHELGDVDSNIAGYKSENLVVDIGQSGAMASSQAQTAEALTEDLRTQLYMTRFVRNYLTDKAHDHQLLPTSSGINNSRISAQIDAYNSLLLQRNNHLANSSSQNPRVIDLEENLAVLRKTIIESLDNDINLLNNQINFAQGNLNRALNKVSQNPTQAKYLLSVERQQKVKESLYLFLLQKREENELTQAFTAYNSRLVEAPHGSMAPTSPKSQKILMIALFLALVIPTVVILLRESLVTTIRGRRDLEDYTIPFVGELPQMPGTKLTIRENGKKKKQKGHKRDCPRLVVENGNRNVMNEAFRVVRSHLEFLTGFEARNKVIMVTSMNPSSGKTFITANLSNSIGLIGKRVLAIDLDLRRGSLSGYANKPHKGISNYLSGLVTDIDSLIVKLGEFDLLPCGFLPPNPSELILSDRFRTLIEALKEGYDYVIIDCPPVEMVADASIIGRYVDVTLFIVRAHLMDRGFMYDLQGWYDEKRYPGMAILLNGTTEAFSHYGYHKYGYRYGYRYSRYGYSYSYGES